MQRRQCSAATEMTFVLLNLARKLAAVAEMLQ
jgi:hypothetical protein